jgi:uncharacterized protein (UPF0303 family)
MNDDDPLLVMLMLQEDTLQFSEFTNDTAFALGMRLVEAARSEWIRGLPLCDNGGR